MKIKEWMMLVSLALTAGGCIPSYQASQSKSEERELSWQVHIGTNKGGIVENTDMSLVPGAELDAFSGATSQGYHASLHTVVPLGRHGIETGLDYMHNRQRFSYHDPMLAYEGYRSLELKQIMLPLSYQVSFLKKQDAHGCLHLKIGYLLQYNMAHETGSAGRLPDFEVKPWSQGLSLGISVFPFRLTKNSRLGFYLDGYRGSPVYHDPYNLPSTETIGSAFWKTGIIYQFQ